MIYVSAWLVYLDGDVNYDYIYSDTPSYGIISPDVSESGTAFLIHKTGAMAIPESTNMNIWSSYGHIQSPYTFRGSKCVVCDIGWRLLQRRCIHFLRIFSPISSDTDYSNFTPDSRVDYTSYILLPDRSQMIMMYIKYILPTVHYRQNK